ncbi:hypothetical protein ACQ4PT_020023 [Festuca glaucescens]
MAAWLAGASSKLARSAARRLAGDLRRRGPGPWFLSSSTVPVLGPTAGDRRGFCSVRRFAGDSAAAATAEESENEFAAGDLQQVVDFPGGKLSFVGEMNFVPESQRERIKCYRVLDDDGGIIYRSRFQEVGKELALKMYSNMVTLQIMDTIFYEAQRQGRISFYLTSNGEEAINIASAAALSADDIVLPQPNEVQGAWCSSMAWLHAARICKPVVRE